jgi:pimeloyl-ACP methyl ester carboxylesterase
MPTWVFLRGLTRESRHWGDFLTQFEQALPQSQVLALDLPGNGLLNRQRSPLQVADMVLHCRDQLAQRQIKPPYHVLAMSLGAMVAVAWAGAYPQEVRAQVLINTSLRPFSSFYQRLRPQNYGLLLRLALLGATPAQWARAVLRLTSNRQPEEVLSHWLALQQSHPVSRANALRQLLAAAQFCAPMSRPLTPTLVLASRQDQLVSVACSQALVRQWRCDFRRHPDAGHDLPLDDGPWVAAQVHDWLVSLEESPAQRSAGQKVP